MFESFSVAATFSIRNMASPVLSTLIREVRALKTEAIGAQAALAEMTKGVGIGNLTKRVTALQDALAKTAATSAEIRGSMAADFDAVGAGLMIAARNARELAAAMGEVQAASRMAAGAGAAVGGGGGRGGSHLHGSIPLGGGAAARFAGVGATGALVGAAAAGAGLMFGAEEQQSIMFALMGANINPQSGRGKELAGQLQAQSRAAASGTVFSFQEVASILPALVNIGLQPENGTGTSIEKMMGLIRPIGMFAESESLFSKSIGKDWGLQQSSVAAMQFAHLAGAYQPDQLRGFLDVLMPVSMATERSPSEMVGTAKYALPIASMMGFNPKETTEMIGLLTALGATGTTAGTGLRQGLYGLLKEGPGASLANQLAQALGGRPGAGSAAGSARAKALHDLGFTDASGKPLFMESGAPSFGKILGIEQSYAGSHKGVDLINELSKVMSVRGANVFAMLAQGNAPQLWSAMQGKVGAFPGATAFQQMAAEGSTVQQWHQFVANLENLANTLMTNSGLLKDLFTILTSLNSGLLKITNLIPSGGSREEINANRTRSLPSPFSMLWHSIMGGSGGSGSLPIPSGAGITGVPDYLKPVGQRGEIIHHGNNVFHINGKDAKSVADEVMMRLNKSLGMSMLSNQGDGDGIMHSPFSSGSGP